MATPQPTTSEILSLALLPPELHLHIIACLDPMSRQLFRATSGYFRRIIPPLAHNDRVEAESSPFAQIHCLLACRACNRLRHRHAFDRDMRGKEGFEWRFCVECGTRPLVEDKKYDELKYMYGGRWLHNGKMYGRCARCEECKAGKWEHVQGGQKGLFEVCGDCKPIGEREGETYYFGMKIRRAVDERRELVQQRLQVHSMGIFLPTGGPRRSRRPRNYAWR